MSVTGRYCKYARDISQAPWSVGMDEADGPVGGGGGREDRTAASNGDEEGVLEEERHMEDGGEGGDGRSGGGIDRSGGGIAAGTKVRKGRSSVEEIICEAVVHCLQCKACRMHPCGREDIDVRMLGG